MTNLNQDLTPRSRLRFARLKAKDLEDAETTKGKKGKKRSVRMAAGAVPMSDGTTFRDTVRKIQNSKRVSTGIMVRLSHLFIH